MRFKKPFIALTSASLLSLAACGGCGDGAEHRLRERRHGEPRQHRRRHRPRPARARLEIDGATEGGTVDVLSVDGAEHLDPTEAYYTNTASILPSLVTRSLTQYVYDPETGQMMLIPDLATDLGTPNDDFTEWTFTIRDGVKYENGDPGHGQGRRVRHLRSMDRTTFPRARPTPTTTSRTATSTRVPTPAATPTSTASRSTATSPSDGQAVPRHALLGHLPGDGPDPGGHGQRPGQVRPAPVGNWSVHVQGLQPREQS